MSACAKVIAMTSPDPAPPQTPPQPPDPRRLTRSSADQVLGGVAGGLGRYFSVDPILFRIGFAVAALAGGAGLLAYFALWLLVPDEHGRTERPSGRTLALVGGGLLLAIGVFGLLPGPGLFIWPGFVGLLALGLLVAAVVGADREGDARSRLLRALLVVLAVVAAGVLGAGAAVGTAFGGGAIVAGIVILLGLGLIAGAFGRGRRWLLVPALVLAAPAALVQAADLRVEGGIGEREYRPADVGDIPDVYRIGAGEMTIDLSDVDFPIGRTVVRVEAGVGEVRVVVPADACVSSDVEIAGGEADVLDHDNAGLDIDWLQTPRNRAGAPELFVDAELVFGAFEILRTGERSDVGDDDHGPFGNHDLDGFGPVAQEACAA